MSEQHPQTEHSCPGCGTVNDEEALKKREYRCTQCNLELAHLDIAANGAIRGIFGWLHKEGDVIHGRYQVKSVLGKGGFGATYLVEDIRLNGKRRALKEVPALMFDEYETNLLSRLNHPSIPDIIDRMEAGGMIYLVLEFGGLRTLGGERKQYPGQRIPQQTLLPWIRQLCEVLIYLHSQETPIVHRDLKPDNVLLDENGRIMLIDFGIAKESAPATMTRTLGRAATHGFSPPEQAMGTGTDERSDIYSLAATFYALLTGENPPAAHERVAGKELTPPSQLAQDIAPELEAAILQALNLNVNRRQQTVQEFVQALEEAEGIFSTQPSGSFDNSNRTVLLGKTSHSTALHPPSIKLPSTRITTANQSSSAKIDASQHVSKRNAIILGVGISSVFVIMTAGYLLWPDEPSENQEVSRSTNFPSGNPESSTEITGANSTDQTQTVPPPIANPVATNPKTNNIQATVNQETTSTSGGTSAIDELTKKWEENKTDTQPGPAPKPIHQPKIITTQINRIPEPPKPRPKSRPKPKPKVESSNNDWLSDFQGSMNRSK
jgi:serine/threonine protein kinase